MSALPIPPPNLALPDDDPDLEDALDRFAGDVTQIATEVAVDPDALAADVAAGEPTDLLPPALRGWRIDGPGTAEWAMRHVARADAELAELAEQAEEWRDRIGYWFTQASGPLLARRAFMTAHLERYALEVRDADPRRKSISVPSGTVKTRSSSRAVEIVDPAMILDWARAFAPDVIQRTERVLVSDLRDVVTIVDVIDLARLTLSDGEVVLWVREGRPVLDDIAGAERTVTSPECPGIGDGWPPGDPSALVGQVEVLADHAEVRHGDTELPLPSGAVTVRDVTITASVVVAT